MFERAKQSDGRVAMAQQENRKSDKSPLNDGLGEKKFLLGTDIEMWLNHVTDIVLSLIAFWKLFQGEYMQALAFWAVSEIYTIRREQLRLRLLNAKKKAERKDGKNENS